MEVDQVIELNLAFHQVNSLMPLKDSFINKHLTIVFHRLHVCIEFFLLYP